ncbi:hypothetical protein MXD61_17035 [Frankia sp. AgPm24]|uniref:hypothetical protein n=1 Tax=Frankia sp. AgPm24 TaxID=631128 RepID=UPI00200CD2FE|nr:hypothetical protein [Frankia sp. AgPm24]MCK9923552.1 hypothetical protein [Frankia sp. AgPm24]
MSTSVVELAREVRLLVRQLRGWAGASWEVPVPGEVSRAQRTVRLINELAVLGERAGVGSPPGMRPPRLAPHALADQVAVLAEELLAALADALEPAGARAVRLLADARTAVTGARTDLDGAGFGFRTR